MAARTAREGPLMVLNCGGGLREENIVMFSALLSSSSFEVVNFGVV